MHLQRKCSLRLNVSRSCASSFDIPNMRTVASSKLLTSTEYSKNELVHLGARSCTVLVQYQCISISISPLAKIFALQKIVSFLPVITIITFGRCAATPTFTLVLGLTLQYLSFDRYK